MSPFEWIKKGPLSLLMWPIYSHRKWEKSDLWNAKILPRFACRFSGSSSSCFSTSVRASFRKYAIYISKHFSFGYSANQLHLFSLPIRHHLLLLSTSLLRIISSTQTDRTHLHDSSPTLSNTWQNWNSKQLIIVPYLLLSGFHQFKFVCPESEITDRCSALT